MKRKVGGGKGRRESSWPSCEPTDDFPGVCKQYELLGIRVRSQKVASYGCMYVKNKVNATE